MNFHQALSCFPRLLLCVILWIALSACPLAPRTGLSPGELREAEVAPERLKGKASPADRSLDVIVNSRGQILLSLFTRPPGSKAPLGGGPSGGETVIGSTDMNRMMATVAPDVGLTTQAVRELCFDTIGFSPGDLTGTQWTIQGQQMAPGRAIGIRWTLPGTQKRPEESALDAALRAAREEAGVPGEKLRMEHVHVDSEKRAAWFRLRYLGNPDDRFLIYDPAMQQGEAYHARSAWVGLSEAPVKIAAAYITVIDGLDPLAARRLLGLGEPRKSP